MIEEEIRLSKDRFLLEPLELQESDDEEEEEEVRPLTFAILASYLVALTSQPCGPTFVIPNFGLLHLWFLTLCYL